MAAAAQDVFRVVDDSIARGGHGVRSDACARLYSLMDLGDKRTMEIRLSAQEIAEDHGAGDQWGFG